MLLSAQNVSKTINDKVLFQKIQFSIKEKDKIAIVGVNGCGKSTLMKSIASLDESVGDFIVPSNIRIHYLPQTPTFSQETALEEMRFENKKNAVPLDEYALKSILSKLGLQDYDLAISSMSGGQRKRLALAMALVSPCDLLLLDEPTNHLDEQTIGWLENQLIKMNCAVVMVSHDRYFLDRICNTIFELDHGSLYVIEGNYQAYLEAKQTRQMIEEKQNAALNNLYRKELEWVRAGVQARGTKSKSRLDRFEELRKKRKKEQEARLQLESASTRLGKKTIEWEDLAFHYSGQKDLFSHFSYRLLSNDRIGIVGLNGCGKSTLLKIFDHELAPTSGTIEWGETVRIGFFRQGDQEVDLNMRVIDYLEETAKVVSLGKDTITASQMLERFLFPKEMHYVPISRLSGGERRRLYLLRVLMQAPNVLLLDEPTNDLDLVTLEILEDYLDTFPGIVIAVSHDRYFLDRIAEHTFLFEEGAILDLVGGYSEALIRMKERPKKEKETKTVYKKERKARLTYMEKKELSVLPELLDSLEKEIESLNAQMSEPNLSYEILSSLTAQRDEKEALLEEKSERWMVLEEKRENE